MTAWTDDAPSWDEDEFERWAAENEPTYDDDGNVVAFPEPHPDMADAPSTLVGGEAELPESEHPADEIPKGPQFFTAEEWDAPVEVRTPDLIEVAGGMPLFYAGESHLLFGHGGDGKSFFLAWCMAQVVKAGGTALWLDYESDRETLRGRLRQCGVTSKQAGRIAYWRVPGPIGGQRISEAHTQLGEFLESCRPTFTVLDSVARALNVAGIKESDNDEAGAWWQRSIRPQFELRGITIATIMHLGHENADHGAQRLTPRGASSWLHQITGAAYRVSVVEAFSQEASGRLQLLCAKDRPGARKKGAVACDIEVRVADDGTVDDFVVSAPAAGATPAPLGKFRPTGLMEKVSRFLEGLPAGETATKRQLRDLGSSGYIDTAVELLAEEGFVDLDRVRNTAYVSKRPYRQDRDAQASAASNDEPF